MKKAEIKTLVLDLGSKEIELTVEQAKKLHKALEEMFGEKTVTIKEYPVYIESQRPYWGYPYQRTF